MVNLWKVSIPDIKNAKTYPGENIWQRYLDFLPFNEVKPEFASG